jgi:hypothetical protein
VQNVTPLPVRREGFRADRTEPILFSPIDPHIPYYAANKLFETRDGGDTWETISPDLTREHTGQPDSLPPLTEKQQAQRRGAIYYVAARSIPSRRDLFRRGFLPELADDLGRH